MDKWYVINYYNKNINVGQIICNKRNYFDVNNLVVIVVSSLFSDFKKIWIFYKINYFLKPFKDCQCVKNWSDFMSSSHYY